MTEQATATQAGDRRDDIIAALCHARETNTPLYISAGGSKRHAVGRDCDHSILDISGHRGIVDYPPGELVITARAATPLVEIEAALREHNQTLSFEPPLYAGRATLGGTLACNLSGPARPWCGSIRDKVLGVQLINGKGERLNFGGKVMKNVAGYDVSRLQAGALGTLGVLSEISVKVEPRAEKTLTLCYEMSGAAAIGYMNARAAEAKPLSGACWLEGCLHLRLSGAASAVNATVTQWGGDVVESDQTLWEDLRDLTLPFFHGDAPLWRFSVQSSALFEPTLGPAVLDWCGAQRWVRGVYSPESMHALAAKAGGHVTLFRGGDRRSELRSPLGTVEQTLQQRLKHAFDPQRILNPGRLYSWL